jgi:hypothetical protein
MKRTILSIIFILTASSLSAQSLSVSGSTSDAEILTADINSSGIEVGEMSVGSYSLPGESDPSLEAYALPDGSVIVRENIANFLIYDTFGTVKKSISNSSQSEGGEAISELSMDPSGKTIVVYNPKVNMNGQTGSRAKLIDKKANPVDVFYSQDRVLSVVEVSSNGEFIAFASSKTGTDDKVELSDRFGNILNTITFDQEVKGVTFSENGLYVAIYSGGRVAAYEVRSGERAGSTSFRNTSVQFAAYDPADKTIIALTGSGSLSLSDIQLHTVNISARKIAREEFSGTLSLRSQPSLTRTGSGRYTISGFDQELNLRAQF